MKRKNILLSVFLILAISMYQCSKDDINSTANPSAILSNSLYNSTGNGGASFEPVGGDKYTEFGENPFVKVFDNPISTFGVDADGGSYSNMRRSINSGQKPPKSSVRVEEFINYFTFDYEEPGSENVSLNTEISTCPWNSQHHLLRIGIKGKTIPNEMRPASNIVFLIDVSGSMSSPDKLGLLKTGFKLMVDGLKSNDKVAIVTYAGQAGVLLQSTKGSEKDKIKSAIDELGAGGSTAGSAGITTAYEIALQNFIQNGNNRIILGTDGDFNVGPSSTKELIEMIEQKRKLGVFLTVLGVGSGNLNEGMMEQLADKGNGNYEYIDNIDQLKKVFVHEYSKFYSVAKDCKIQVTFNYYSINSYRLIGYENRILDQQEFSNDTIDAGEIGSGQTITALYEILLANNSINDYAVVDFRYKMPNDLQSRLISIKADGAISNFNNATENTRFCAAVAGYGMLLKESQYKGDLTKQMIINMASGAKTFDPNSFRNEFINLVKKTNE